MTEQTTTETTTETTTDPQNAGTPGTTGVEDEASTDAEGSASPDKANREAARYRTRARDAETERDQLRDRLDAVHRRDIERVAGEHLAVGADLFTFGTEMEDLLDDDGYVDPARVADAATQLLATRPGLAKGRPQGPSDFGGGSTRGAAGMLGGSSWSEVLQSPVKERRPR